MQPRAKCRPHAALAPHLAALPLRPLPLHPLLPLPSPAAPVRILGHPVLVIHPSPAYPALRAAPSSSRAPGRSTGEGRSCHVIDGVNGKIAGVSLDEYTGRKLGVVGCKARGFYRISD
jgi:hypothetical protein